MTTPERFRRAVPEKPRTGRDWRGPGERDYDRILYSSAFRRLVDVTQVVAADQGHVFHNRLTHSLQVSQVACRLAQRLIRKDDRLAARLGGISPDVAAAAGLAHDLGHPPFGHVSEEELDHLVTEVYRVADGFEGNAQSFRIVNALARREPAPHPPGLDLTPATLNAMLKYPWFRELDAHDSSKPATVQNPAERAKKTKTKRARKWGAYRLERNAFDIARSLFPIQGSDRKSPEAEIMDWADDLTFAVHDAEDFYRAGLIPLDRLSLKDDAERTHFFDGILQRPELLQMIEGKLTSEYVEAFYKVIIGFPLDERYAGATSQRSNLRYFVSMWVGEFINAFELVEPTRADQPFVQIDPLRLKMVKMLKLLTWHYVILNPSLATQQFGQRRIIQTLFAAFHDAATNARDNIFPHAFRDAVKSARERGPELITRTVADLISGMTERQAIEMYQRLTGISLGSVMNSIL